MSIWKTLSPREAIGSKIRLGGSIEGFWIRPSKSCSVIRTTTLNPKRATMTYKADITAGSLKLAESRIIADLLLRDVDAAGWNAAIVTQNVLQARNSASPRRLTRLIRGRLETMGRNCGSSFETEKAPSPPMRCSPPPLKTALCSAISCGSLSLSSIVCLILLCHVSCGQTTWTVVGNRSKYAAVERIDSQAASVFCFSDGCTGGVHREYSKPQASTGSHRRPGSSLPEGEP